MTKTWSNLELSYMKTEMMWVGDLMNNEIRVRGYFRCFTKVKNFYWHFFDKLYNTIQINQWDMSVSEDFRKKKRCQVKGMLDEMTGEHFWDKGYEWIAQQATRNYRDIFKSHNNYEYHYKRRHSITAQDNNNARQHYSSHFLFSSRPEIAADRKSSQGTLMSRGNDCPWCPGMRPVQSRVQTQGQAISNPLQCYVDRHEPVWGLHTPCLDRQGRRQIFRAEGGSTQTDK